MMQISVKRRLTIFHSPSISPVVNENRRQWAVDHRAWEPRELEPIHYRRQRQSDTNIPGPPRLNRPGLTQIVKLISNDNLANELHALVTQLPLNAQP